MMDLVEFIFSKKKNKQTGKIQELQQKMVNIQININRYNNDIVS